MFNKRKKNILLYDLLKGTHGFNLFSDITLNVLNGVNCLIPHTGQTILFPDSDDNSDISNYAIYNLS